MPECTKRNKKRLRMPEEDIIGKTKNGARNNNKKKYANKFVAFNNSQSCTKRASDGITNRHRNCNSKKNSATSNKKQNRAKVGCKVY